MMNDTVPPSPLPRVVEYVIDADNIVLETGPSWVQTAVENDAPELSDARGLDLFAAITDPNLGELWRIILASVRRTREGRSFNLRCDAPSLRRLIELDVRPYTGGRISFRSCETRVEVREPVRLLDRRVERNDSLLRICAWCARAQASTWVPVEEAVERLMLLEQRLLPRISHGICPDCFAKTALQS